MIFDAYYNGCFMNKRDVRVSLTDRAVFFGDGVYDAVLGRGGRCFLLAEHLQRLYKNAALIGLTPPLDFCEIKTVITALTEKIKGCFFLYLQFSRRGGERAHAWGQESGTNILLTVTEKEPPDYKGRMKLISYPDLRYFMCNIKTLNLLPSVLASKAAEEAGADEAVFHRDFTVTECAHSNVHIIKSGVLFTHPNCNLILPGIERAHLLSVCRELGAEYKERAFTLGELSSADEVIVTSTTKLGKRAFRFEGTDYSEKYTLGEQICKKMQADFEKDTDFAL